MKKGFMMGGKAFGIETTNTNCPATTAKELGQSMKVAKSSKEDMITGDFNSNKYHSK